MCVLAELRDLSLTGARVQTDQELEVGLLSIATPIRTLSGKTVGAANVGIPTVRTSPDHMIGTVLPKLRETCDRIELEQKIASLRESQAIFVLPKSAFSNSPGCKHHLDCQHIPGASGL